MRKRQKLYELAPRTSYPWSELPYLPWNIQQIIICSALQLQFPFLRKESSEKNGGDCVYLVGITRITNGSLKPLSVIQTEY